MTKIPKVIHYVWFGRGEKSESFISYLESWKKYCPEYEIKEWNEDNFDITENYYMKKFYDKELWAFASDYARVKILYEYGGIYLDTDVELIKNFDDLLENDAFLGFQDVFSIGCSVIGAKKGDNILKEVLEIYETKKIRIVLPNLFTKIFKKHSLKKYNNKIQKIDGYTIYPKDYFFPYAYFENKEDMKITNKTFTIHHYDATWLPKIVTIIAFPIIGFFARKVTNKNLAQLGNININNNQI